MKVAIFAKKRTTRDGKPFTSYVTRLMKKDGESIACGVRFREECGSPKESECPCYIEFDKSDANMTEKTIEITDPETNEIRDVTSRTLWITNWTTSPEKYVDHSLDDFE